jgi:hypothetical protein
LNRADFQRISQLRIAEAHALMASVPPHPSGAYYLAGYAVECALKAVICKRYQAFDWPERRFVLDCHTHDLETLCELANLEDDLKVEIAAKRNFKNNWLSLRDWSEGSRYLEYDSISAAEFIKAIDDPADGVLPWIMTRW